MDSYYKHDRCVMCAQDEVSIVVKFLRLGAFDYLVKLLRTNELFNLWTHMWRRRKMLGLPEKDAFSHDIDLALSDHSDANTSSVTLLSDDSDDKVNKASKAEISISINGEHEIEVKWQVKTGGSGVQRNKLSLSYHSVCSSRKSSSEESVARALCSCHSQPLNFLEEERNATSGVISLAEYLGTNVSSLVPEIPNKLLEDMVRCMGAIFCKLADPPVVNHYQPTSPGSSFSSMSVVSPQYLTGMWSPTCSKRESAHVSRLINPFNVEGLKEFSVPYNAMVEVPQICTDRQRLQDVKNLLLNYKSILQCLESVDPGRMKNVWSAGEICIRS